MRFLWFSLSICYSLNLYAFQNSYQYLIFNKSPDNITVSYKYCKKLNGAGRSGLSDCIGTKYIEISAKETGKIPFEIGSDQGILVTSIQSREKTVIFADDKQVMDMIIHGISLADIMQCDTSSNKLGVVIEKIIENTFTCKFEYMQ